MERLGPRETVVQLCKIFCSSRFSIPPTHGVRLLNISQSSQTWELRQPHIASLCSTACLPSRPPCSFFLISPSCPGLNVCVALTDCGVLVGFLWFSVWGCCSSSSGIQLAPDQSLHVTVAPGSPLRSSLLYSGGFTVAPICNLWVAGNGRAAAHLTTHAMGDSGGS